MSGDLKERIEKLLASLGPDAGAVAESLRDKRITGARMTGDSCPIATLLKTEIADLDGVRWGWDWDDDGGWGPKDYYCDVTYTYVPGGTVEHPPPVQDFIAAFDENEYPDLVGAER